jgi:ABC-type dipeptide/oligopeptide/nickel transport system ATPase component
MSDDKMLQIKNLTVRYAGRGGFIDALRGLTFNVGEGEILGIVGESGSGKSTFALSVLDLLPLDSQREGEISFAGKNIFSFSPRQLQDMRGNGIGLIFQEPAATFNPVLSIGYQFNELLSIKGRAGNRRERNKRIAESLARVSLQERERILASYPHQLSGGQLQRVAIAMAISLGPKILIADEPTSSLDVTTESQIVHLFQELRVNLHLTLIFITHNLDLVRALCDRVVVLYKGQLREQASVQDVFASPHDAYTKELLSSLKELEG